MGLPKLTFTLKKAARTVAAALNRMFYAPLFVDDASRHWHPRIPDFEQPLG